MKCIFLMNLAFILSAASSCTKDNMVQDQNPEPIISNNTPVVSFDTINIVLTEWYQLPDNEYRSVIILPSQPNYNSVNEYLQFFIDYFGQYQQLTGNAINYSGGKLWHENYSGENVILFQSDNGNLPFDSLEIRAIITIEH